MQRTRGVARTTCRAEWRASPGRAGCPSPQSAGAPPHTPRRRSCPAPAACARSCRTRPRAWRWRWGDRRSARTSATPCSTCRCGARARQPGAPQLRGTRGGHAPVHPGAPAEDVVALLAHEREAAHPAHNLGAGALVHLHNLVRRQQVIPAAHAGAREQVRQGMRDEARYRGFEERAAAHHCMRCASSQKNSSRSSGVAPSNTVTDKYSAPPLCAMGRNRVGATVKWVGQLEQSVRVRAARGPGAENRATAALEPVLTEPRAMHRRAAAQRAERSRRRGIFRK